MSALTNVQIIEQAGKPAFAVLPYDEYLALVEDDVYIPHDVVSIMIDGNCSIYSAWRKHLGLTQKYVAEMMGVAQSRIAKIEKDPEAITNKTRKEYASALGINPRLLDL